LDIWERAGVRVDHSAQGVRDGLREYIEKRKHELSGRP
jgi:hypothetical protein